MTSVPPPSTPPSQGPPQGWYQDPQGSGLRWWDGAAWTEHTHEQLPAEPAQAEATGEAPAQQDDDLGLTIGGDDEPTGSGAAAAPAASAEQAASAAPAASPASAAPPGAASTSPTTQPSGDAGATAPPRPDTTIPESGPASEGLRRYARLLILLAILVATLIAALFVFNGDDDDGGGGGGGSASEGDIIFADSQAQSAARTAQTAIETYSNDNGGSYEGATPQDLAEIENTLEGTDLSVDAQEDTYAITVNSKTGGNTFTISRTSDGQVTLGCAEPGTGACPENGTWGN